MRLLTWNIQCGKGCDGVTDLSRTVAVARQSLDADVFCFQEVSVNFSRLGDGADQSAQLASLLPGYSAIFRPAIETMARRMLDEIGGRPVLLHSGHFRLDD